MINFKENSLILNGKSISFVHPIEEVKPCGSGYLVLLEYYKKTKTEHYMKNNVFYVSDNLEVLWQVEGPKPRCYVGIAHYDENYRAVSLDGTSGIINLETGKILQEDFVK